MSLNQELTPSPPSSTSSHASPSLLFEIFESGRPLQPPSLHHVIDDDAQHVNLHGRVMFVKNLGDEMRLKENLTPTVKGNSDHWPNQKASPKQGQCSEPQSGTPYSSTPDDLSRRFATAESASVESVRHDQALDANRIGIGVVKGKISAPCARGSEQDVGRTTRYLT